MMELFPLQYEESVRNRKLARYQTRKQESFDAVVPTRIDMNINHPSHRHVLVLESVQEPYQCNGCKELGFRPCFKCKKCNFNLHKECAIHERSAFHPFFRDCEFKFNAKAPGFGDRYCDGCGKDVQGFVYQCLHDKAHDLHPCCMKLQRTLMGDGMTLQLKNKVSKKCLKCGSKEISRGFRGWSYESTCGQYCFHVACVKDLIFENWMRGYFDGQNMAMQIMVPNQDMVQQTGGSSSRKKASKYLGMAKVALKIIISAIFGDPTAAVATVIESLLSS